MTLLDDRSVSTSSLDPGASFVLEVRCRDNNTVADIYRIRVVAYSSASAENAQDTASGHYSFSWVNSTGFHGSSLELGQCRAPADAAAAEGTWRFRVRLDRAARTGAWTIVAIVEDEAKSERKTMSFIVNRFTSFSLSTNSLHLAGQPGSVAVTSLKINYSSNNAVEVGARATTFVGKEVPSFTLKPEDFTIDDDPSTEAPDTGSPMLTLSSTRQVFVGRLEGSGQLDVWVFVKIPSSFLDQEYEGNLIFDARSR